MHAMKALVLKEYNRFAYEDVDTPHPAADEVLIQVMACGICGSDVHGMDGSTGRRRPPIIMGHEAAGVIVEAGANVVDWARGDKVTFDSTVYCGACWFCRRGQVNLCDRRMVLGVSCAEYRRHGAFAQYVAVPQHILYRLPEGITFVQAAMAEALSVAVHAVNRTPMQGMDSCVVVGAGMIGLLVIQTLRVRGAGPIIAVDVDAGRLALARQFGAAAGLNASDPGVLEEIRKCTGGRGADRAFDVVGLSPTLQQAMASLRKGGTLTMVGNLSPTVDLPLQAAVTREITLLGSCASCGEYPACLDLIASGRVNVDALISAVAPLSDGEAWFQRLYRKEPGLMKVILQPPHE